ncbi:DMT family transporter [Haloglomus litoreum]|uniref:DMT family transporter n=1 Tax=Haloglomus litoreum TaxID=3034026 RepID=UPI0023E7782F|nr:DMT family transporter [Haloglomus sp. DT116]
MELTTASLGIVLAVGAALLFAVQNLCVRLGTEEGDVVGVMLVSLVCNVVVLVPIVLVLYPPPYQGLFTPISLASFAGAGLFGSLVGRVLMFKSIEVIGASRTTPIISSNVFFASALAILLLGETLTMPHLLGILLIVGGVAFISWETAATSAPNQSLRQIGASLVVPLAAAASIGIEPVLAAQGFAEGTQVLPGVMVKVVAATLGFGTYVLLYSSFEVPIGEPIFRWYIGAGVAASVGLTLYYAALEVAPVVIVVPILQTMPLFVVVLSFLFLPQRLERVTVRLGVAAAVVVVGATVVSLSG